MKFIQVQNHLTEKTPTGETYKLCRTISTHIIYLFQLKMNEHKPISFGFRMVLYTFYIPQYHPTGSTPNNMTPEYQQVSPMGVKRNAQAQ